MGIQFIKNSLKFLSHQQEYEDGQTAEAKFVKDLDRLDLIMQAFEYEKRDSCPSVHQEFFDNTEGKIEHPFVKKIVEEIYAQRKATMNGLEDHENHKNNLDNLESPDTKQVSSSSS